MYVSAACRSDQNKLLIKPAMSKHRSQAEKRSQGRSIEAKLKFEAEPQGESRREKSLLVCEDFGQRPGRKGDGAGEHTFLRLSVYLTFVLTCGNFAIFIQVSLKQDSGRRLCRLCLTDSVRQTVRILPEGSHHIAGRIVCIYLRGPLQLSVSMGLGNAKASASGNGQQYSFPRTFFILLILPSKKDILAFRGNGSHLPDESNH